MSIHLQSRVWLKGLVVLLWTLAAWVTPQRAEAQTYRCLPTCSAVDGRFLAISGSNLANLSDSSLNLSISVPAGTSSFDLGIFDGDANGLDGAGVSHWDISGSALYEYTLFADPMGNGSGNIPIEWSPGVTTLLSTSMPDNAWIDYAIDNVPQAETPSGNYFYRLNIRLTNPLLTTTNAFKVRTTAILSGVTLNPTLQPFSYIANIRGLADLQLVYPAYPSLTPTNYDGIFRFYFDLPTSQSELAIWDGDFDRGKYDGADQDTDDPDTSLLLPPWATIAALPEGVAVGTGGTTGNPSDDRNPSGFNIYTSIPPSVSYQLIFPDGQTFLNNNPSGNLEWEQFRISTDSYHPSQMDYSTTSIPAGTYELRGIGVDMQNFNALLLPFRLLCVEENGTPCRPLRPFRIGDRVFDSCQEDEGGEGPGIAGVTLELIDELGSVLATTVTDEDGLYSFPVEAATYTVRVADSNFEPGGPLDGFISTNGVSKTETVVDDNVLTFDFGFCGQGSIGDRIWEDTNGDGLQDSDEPGPPDVLVELLDGDGNVLDQAFTNGDGEYLFTAVQAGTYTVRVDPGFLPEGLTPSADLDGIATPHEAVVDLNPGEDREDVDFGYTGSANGSIGDRVWADTDGDGMQDAGEPGIPGVTVRLRDGDGNEVATATTDANGLYAFESLAVGTYSVEIDATTLSAGSVPSYDLDGIATPNTTSVELGEGQERTDVDFGYRGSASIGDRLWTDVDGDGTQDAGEPGLNGVTVELLDGNGNVLATTTTTGDGNYTFPNLLGGTYTVRVIQTTLPAGAAPSYDLDGIGTPHQATVTVTGGAARTDVDFGYRGTGSIGDRVWYDSNGNGTQDPNEEGLTGVAVELLLEGNVVATTTTGADGIYTFNNLAGGTHTVRVVATTLPAGAVPTYDLDGIATPHTAVATLANGASRTDVDFGYRGSASLGDRVWYDVDGDGTQDAGETGLTGVTVELLDADGNVISTTTTGADGIYTFGGLLAGTYNVRVDAASLPADAVPTYDLDGAGTPNTTGVTVTGTETIDTVDFGYRGTASLGDRLWYDNDSDGAQETGENGLTGVTVELLNGDGNVVATTTTGADGTYTFGNLLAGSYTVRVVAATLPAGVAPTYDLDGIATANTAAVTLAAGANRDDVDFGYRGTGSLGDRLWNDTNGNGAQDAGETGLTGITVELLDNGGNVIATTTTGADGIYTFENLGAGSYTVRVVAATLPAGVAPTYDLDGIGSANTAAVTLTGGQNRTDVDFGYRGTASIGDRLWNDANGNGAQDAGEAGMTGVTVELLDNGGNVIATTTTGADGIYTFSNLNAGNYTVRVVAATLPAGVAPTYDLDGIGSANTAAVTLTGGQNRTDVDFGYRAIVGTLTIGDRVWNDADGDGTQDAEETGINGVTVQLLDGATVLATTVTAGDGSYSFNSLHPGTYTIRVDPATLPANVGPTYDADGTGTPHTATIALATSRTDVDFGYRGSKVVRPILECVINNGNNTWTAYFGYLNENGLPVTIPVGTDNRFSPVPEDRGQPTSFQTGRTPYWPDAAFNVVFDGNNLVWNLNGRTATANRNSTPCSNHVFFEKKWQDADGNVSTAPPTNLPSTFKITATSSLGSAVCTYPEGAIALSCTYTNTMPPALDNNGLWVPVGSSYTVTETGLPPGVSILSGTGVQTLPDPDCVPGRDGLEKYCTHTVRNLVSPTTSAIGDRLWNDTDGDGIQDGGEAGLSGVTVELLDNSGNVVATTTTGANGIYNFNNLVAGSYTVRVASATLPAGVAPTYDLDGTATAHTAAVTVEVDQTRTDVDFGYRTTVKASIGDRVWYDTDGDGVQDAGEPGLDGTTVELLNGSGTVIATTTAGANGVYTFTNLSPGTYTVRVVASTLPVGGVSPTYDLDGTGTPHTAVVTLSGTNRTDVDFGYRGTRSVGDRVWNDVDGDGSQDASEAGINGVTVRLYLGATEVASTVTAGNGNYTFPNLPEATFTVRIDTATLPAGLVQTYDLDGLATPHQATFNLTTSRTDVDFGYRTPPVTCTAGYFKDHFNAASFSNNDGTLNWAGAWIEADSAGAGVSSGNVTAGSPYAGYLFLRNHTSASTQPSAARQANLAGAASATLSFVFHVRTAVDPSDAVVIEISNNGGSTYTVLETLTGFTGTYERTRSYNISSYIASNTRIRFRVINGYTSSDELFKLDWVKIDTACTPSNQNASIGNRVWNDTDGDGSQDSGEAGINGVTVQLLNGSGTVIATTTTAGNGDYTFGSLAAGNYSVRIVTSTLPAGVTPTYDLDGTGTAHVAAVTLANGQNRTDVDFGYRTPPVSCTAGYFKDHFNAASFSNNDGTLSWAGAWIETDTAGSGVSSGNVTVGSPYAGYLFLRKHMSASTQPSAARQANLAGATSATLSFAFHVRTAVDPSDAVVVEISKDGGSTYTVLETLTGFTGTYEGTRIHNISAFSASNTRIRFRVTNGYTSGDEIFKLDWVKIDTSCGSTAPGTGTLGYWKNHEEAWPVDQITVGGRTYTKSQAIALMGTSGAGDKTYDMFKQLVAAKLNVLVGNEASCINSTIASADSWMATYPAGSKVSSGSSAWSTASGWHTKLDDYNNGELCAPHRD